tara:strand:- start:5 stop:898 length:894 start_codon:yes stop_codon:yes gene_type:complete
MLNFKNLFIGLLILVIFIFFSINYWRVSPSYSLSQIHQSIEKKDPSLFYKHVDVENIFREFFMDSSKFYEQYFSDSFGIESDDISFNPEEVAETVFFFTNPHIESSIRNGLGDIWNDPSKAVSTKLISEEDLDIAHNIFQSAELSYLKKDGDKAFLGISMLDSDFQEIITEFELKKVKNYWQISKWSNYEELLNEIADNFINSLVNFREDIESALFDTHDFKKFEEQLEQEWEDYEQELENIEGKIEQELEDLEKEFDQELENLEREFGDIFNTNEFEKELESLEDEFEDLLNSYNE